MALKRRETSTASSVQVVVGDQRVIPSLREMLVSDAMAQEAMC